MNKKIAGMSVGAIVILAVVAFVVYWFAFRTEGFSQGNLPTISFPVTNNGKGVIIVQILGLKNGSEAINKIPFYIKPNETVTVRG